MTDGTNAPIHLAERQMAVIAVAFDNLPRRLLLLHFSTKQEIT